MANLVGLTVLLARGDLCDKTITKRMLTSFTQLTSLFLMDRNKYKITQITKLRELCMFNKRMDVDWIEELPNLTSLELETWPKYSPSTLTESTNLRHLTIREYMPEHYHEDIGRLTNLESLTLYGTEYHSCLSQLTKLTKLGVESLGNHDILPSHIMSLFVYFSPTMRPSFSSLQALHIGN